MAKEESQNIEYKQSWHDDYLRWVCGFANAKGGTIWIGVDDKRKVVGVNGAKKLMEDIPNKIKDTMGIVVDVALVNLNPGVTQGGTQDGTQGDTQGVTQDVTQDVTQGRARTMDAKMVAYIRANKKVTIAKLAELFDCVPMTIKRHLAKMPNVRYVGHGYSGHWEVD